MYLSATKNRDGEAQRNFRYDGIAKEYIWYGTYWKLLENYQKDSLV